MIMIMMMMMIMIMMMMSMIMMIISGMFLPGAFLIGTGFIGCEQPFLAVAILSIAVGFSGLQYAGFIVNHVDIAPPFAGILFGISNTAATLPGILAPYAIGVITADVSICAYYVPFGSKEVPCHRWRYCIRAFACKILVDKCRLQTREHY